MIFQTGKYYTLGSMVFKVLSFTKGVIRAIIVDPELGQVAWEYDYTDGEYRELSPLEMRLRGLAK